VNFFQPSFKLAEKTREGAQVRKRYHPPATPCQRLLADPRTPAAVRERVTALKASPTPRPGWPRDGRLRPVTLEDKWVRRTRSKPVRKNLSSLRWTNR